MEALRYEVHPNQVSTWKRQAMDGLAEIFSQPALKRNKEHEAKVWGLQMILAGGIKDSLKNL